MIVILGTALSGIKGQSLKLDNIASNLANISTTGYKKSRVTFSDSAYNYIGSGAIGSGVNVASIDKLFSQGSLSASAGSLDVSIQGDGFFQFERPDGVVVFTRDGAFSVDGQNRIVNAQGYVLNPQISVPADATSLNVAEDGTVSVTRPGAAAPQAIGQIQLVHFSNPGGLTAEGNNTFSASANSGTPLSGIPGQGGLGTIGQGFLEMSNVDIVEEMTQMMIAQRAYEANLKVFKAGDEMFAVTLDIMK